MRERDHARACTRTPVPRSAATLARSDARHAACAASALGWTSTPVKACKTGGAQRGPKAPLQEARAGVAWSLHLSERARSAEIGPGRKRTCQMYHQ